MAVPDPVWRTRPRPRPEPKPLSTLARLRMPEWYHRLWARVRELEEALARESVERLYSIGPGEKLEDLSEQIAVTRFTETLDGESGGLVERSLYLEGYLTGPDGGIGFERRLLDGEVFAYHGKRWIVFSASHNRLTRYDGPGGPRIELELRGVG